MAVCCAAVIHHVSTRLPGQVRQRPAPAARLARSAAILSSGTQWILLWQSGPMLLLTVVLPADVDAAGWPRSAAQLALAPLQQQQQQQPE